MRAIHLTNHGGIENLTYVTNALKPSVGAGEVLIRIKASSLNNLDLVVRRGYPGIEMPLPHIPGGDIAGIIEQVGGGVKQWKPGDRVLAFPTVFCGRCSLCLEGCENLCLNFKVLGLHRSGGWAEYLSLPARNVIPIPEGVSFNDAASIPIAGLTAYHGLHGIAHLQPKQIFFIWGGSGGLGAWAIQIAKSIGAVVIATGSSPEKLEAMRNLGADYVLNHKTDDIAGEVRSIAPEGVHVIMNYVGPAVFQASFDMLRKGGTMMLCGIITGRESNFNMHMTYLRHLSIRGLYLGTMQEMKQMVDEVNRGKLKPIISSVLPLERAAESHQLMESGNRIGKIIIEI